tara:strand:- start:16118 stop:16327 length:210 start_codon:yes stop_codon:yes gene_type:complete
VEGAAAACVCWGWEEWARESGRLAGWGFGVRGVRGEKGEGGMERRVGRKGVGVMRRGVWVRDWGMLVGG